MPKTFAATEVILIEAVKKGANRQEVHERIRTISMKAWEHVQKGKENPMSHLLKEDTLILAFVSQKEIESLLNVTKHIGTAPKRAKMLVAKIGQIIKLYENKQ